MKVLTHCVVLGDSGREIQTAGPKHPFPKVSSEKRGTVRKEVSRERNVLDGEYGRGRSEYALKFIQVVVRETSKKRITVV